MAAYRSLPNVSECVKPDVDGDKTNTEISYCNYCKIIVTNGDMKLIVKNKIQIQIQIQILRIFFGVFG